VAGYWLAALVRAAFTITVITIVALVAGLAIAGSAVDLAGLYTLAVLVNAAAMLFGSGVAMRLRTMQAGPAMQTPAFLFLFLAPVWVPYDLLTGWVQAAASVNPATLVLEAGRGFLAGDPTDVLPAFAATLLVAAVTLLWARGGLRSAERVA
jgi:ABC-2 type transport system permease protein